jgi:hypothetical protein
VVSLSEYWVVDGFKQATRNLETKVMYVSVSNLFFICIAVFLFAYVRYPLYVSGFAYLKYTEFAITITVHPNSEGKR